MSGRGHVAWALGVMSVSLAVVGLAVAGDGVWTSHGPEGGNVSVIVVDPQGSNTVYAAAGGGVYKSTDAGQYWKQASVGLPSVVLDAVVIDPQTSTTLYAAAAGYNGGVFTSTDGGRSWAALRVGPLTGSLAIDPQEPITLYAGGGDGVFKTTDAGRHRTATNAGLITYCAFVRVLAVDP